MGSVCEYIIIHALLAAQSSHSVILWIELGGKPKWLPVHFGYHAHGVHKPPLSQDLKVHDKN